MTDKIQIQGLTYRIAGRNILSDVSFVVGEGAFTVVVGENGAGKTTLLHMLMGLAQPHGGEIRVLGAVPHQDPYALRRRIGYLAEKIRVPSDWTVEEFLAFHRFFYQDAYSLELESELMTELRLKKEWCFGNLSAGQVRRAQVVGALAASPEILVIDEITAVLDIVGRAKFMAALHRLRTRLGSTVIMATNILDDVDTYATDIVLLHQGKVQAAERKERLLRNQEKTGPQSLSVVLAEMIERAEGGPS